MHLNLAKKYGFAISKLPSWTFFSISSVLDNIHNSNLGLLVKDIAIAGCDIKSFTLKQCNLASHKTKHIGDGATPKEKTVTVMVHK